MDFFHPSTLIKIQFEISSIRESSGRRALLYCFTDTLPLKCLGSGGVFLPLFCCLCFLIILSPRQAEWASPGTERPVKAAPHHWGVGKQVEQYFKGRLAVDVKQGRKGGWGGALQSGTCWSWTTQQDPLKCRLTCTPLQPPEIWQ